ncbi:MAG: GNAT family N-acetyltransferase [Chloroflexota bacterium]
MDGGTYLQVEGDITRLRPACWGFNQADLLKRYHWSLNDELQYWSGSIPGGRSFSQFVDTVAGRDWPEDGRRVSYAILTKEDELIGMVSCYNIDRRWPNRLEGELGVYLGEQSCWGRGYGTDAVRSFLGHLFRDLEFSMIYLHTYENNLRAQKSYLRVGFEVDETKRRYSPRVGYHNELRMTMTREQYSQRYRELQPAGR